jgi:ankyrin repeat protein
LVALQLDVLSKQRSVKDIRTAMKTLPKTLDEFYDRILLQIEEEDRDQAHIALQWIAFVVRPITLGELAEAIIVSPLTEPALDEEDRVLDCKTLLDFLPSGLVSAVEYYSSTSFSSSRSDFSSISDTQYISEDDESEGGYSNRNDMNNQNLEDVSSNTVIRCAHFSVKEYLVSTRILHGSAPNFQVQEMATHSLIAKTCFAYMLWIGSKEPKITDELLSDFPLLGYSARCWTSHMCALDGHIEDVHLQNLAMSFLAVDAYSWRIWASTGLPNGGWSAENLFRMLLTDRAKIKENPEVAVHPLTWASLFSMTSVVRLLLPRTPSIDDIQLSKYSWRFYGYPLYAASRFGSLETVQMLVKADASVNHPNPDYTPALWGAAEAGSYEKVKFLLDQGADVNAIALDGSGSALTVAVASGSKSVLELLLQYGADVNAKSEEPETALHFAASIGFLDGVQLLLDAGASINYTGQFGTALRAAVSGQNEDVVKLLLQSGADPNIESLLTKELLRIGSKYQIFGRRQCEMLKLLLDSGLKVGIEDWRYIYEKSIDDIRRLEAKLREDRTSLGSQQLEEAKSSLELFEALPQWQAVKDTVLSN